MAALREVFPHAPVYTLAIDKRLRAEFHHWPIHPSPLQGIYDLIPSLPALLPLIPWAVRQLDFSAYDIVLSSSSLVTKGLRLPRHAIHICYCHTPPRFLWLDRESYLKQELAGARKVLRPFLRLLLNYLTKVDYLDAQEVDYFLTNCKNCQERIQCFYGRGSEVIHPFVDSDLFYPEGTKENYYLVAGRTQGHKAVDLAIRAFNKNGRDLHVVGTGRALSFLKSIAGPNIRFLGRVGDDVLRREYCAARGYVFPQEEDFGITPLEANACGTPVIAFRKGGALETVMEGQTGIFFDKQTVESLCEAVEDFEHLQFQTRDLCECASQFSKEKFKTQVRQFVGDVWRSRRGEPGVLNDDVARGRGVRGQSRARAIVP